jgi:malate dehydrogenase (quinone)
MMQDLRMPFAATHGDPDLTIAGVTRFGPTARFFPVLESRKLGTVKDFFASAGLGKLRTWAAFFKILLEPVRFAYLMKNLVYELPYIGKYFFASQIRKIVPSVRNRDVQRAEGFGGMRLQRVDINTRELLLGEGKIVGDNIIFNMTPSPGASVCLYNAWRDTEQIVQFFGSKFTFDKDRMDQYFFVTNLPTDPDVSAKTYLS